MRPLSKLRVVGFLCPCHESDDEYSARVAVNALRGIPIQWYRESSTTSWERSSPILLDASLKIVDTQRDGPCLQVKCRDAASLQIHTFIENPQVILQTPRECILRIPFTEMEKIELVETSYHSEIHILNNNKLLLRFSLQQPASSSRYCCCIPLPPSPLLVVEYLQAILKWNTERQDVIMEKIERRLAALRLREERQRLMKTNDDEQQASRMVIV